MIFFARYFIIFLIGSLVQAQIVCAQFNLGFQTYHEIKVVEGNDTLKMPWAGGLNNPQFSSLDIDLDGNLDLIAYERDGEVFRGFKWLENESFSPLSNIQRLLPNVGGSYVLFRDYDGDGKQDIFSSAISNTGLRVHRNTSTTTDLSFELKEERLWFNVPGQGNLFFFVPPNDLPVLRDFNGDGDIDMMLQGSTGLLSYPALLYFENRSQELYNNSDSLVFRLENPCWGRVREFITSSGWTAFECDTSNIIVDPFATRGQRHGGTTLNVYDMDGDQNLDLITGDAYSGHISVMYNTNENVDAVIDLSLSDTTFPSYDEPAFVPTLPGIFMEDVNHDGITDMLVTPNQLTASASFYLDTSINTNVDWYYRNEGNAASPDFQLVKKGFISGEMIDVGAKSMPAVADINGDGLLDIIIGGEGYTIYGGAASAKIQVYLNVGNDTTPVFQLADDDLANISVFDFGNVHPALADLDNDGDVDLMIGDENGRLHYFENQGTPSQYNFQLTEPEFADIDVDLGAHPQFFDLSDDGLPDLIIGDFYGRVHYHENAGTATNPDFSKNATVEKIGNILTFQEYGGESTPYFTRKLDSLGTNLYLLLSNANGTILVYGPIKDLTTLADPMQPADSIVLDATATAITGANIFGDFREELIIGQRTGGLFILRREKDIPLGIRPNPEKLKKPFDFQVYPNPSTGTFNLKTKLTSVDNPVLVLKCYNISGKEVINETINAVDELHVIDLNKQPNGIYLLQIQVENDLWQQRILKH